MRKSPKKLGEILFQNGIITQAQLEEVLVDQKTTDKFLGMILEEKGFLNERDLAIALAEQFEIEFVDLKTQYIDMELARKFPTSLLLDHKCFPLKETEETLLFVITNPLDVVALSRLEEDSLPRTLELVIASESDMADVLEQYRKNVSQGIQRLLKRKPIDGSQQ
jgi:hypothetical protein